MFNFFRKPAFGLDISDFSIEVLRLERKAGKLYLEVYGRVKLERGIVKDGKILKKEKLKEKIKELIQNTKPQPLKGNQIILSLPESKTFFYVFKLSANLKGKELQDAVEKEALKTIPLKSEKIYSDFQIVSKTKDSKTILYVGALKEIIDEYSEVLKEAGLKPLVLDTESASLARAFEKEMVKDGEVLIVDIGARTTILTVYDKNSIRFSAVISVAGNNFTQAISEKLKTSLKEAEKLKKNCGLDSKKKEGKVMLILQNVLQDVLDEIKKSISFYEKRSKGKIKKVLLCGGSSLMPKLASYFSLNLLNVETKLADPFKGISVKRKIQKSVLFSNVIGLAKRALEKDPQRAGINLIPEKERGKPVIGKKLLVILVVILAFGVLGWVVYSYIFKAAPIEAPFTGEQLPLEEEEIMPEEELLPRIIILETPTGWLRVREGPGTNYPEITKIYSGETYPLLEESEGWYKIELEDGGNGWIHASYATKE